MFLFLVFFVVSLRIFPASSFACDRFLLLLSPLVAHSALFSDPLVAATWLCFAATWLFFRRHVACGVSAASLLGWARCYPGAPSILGRHGGRPALPRPFPLGVRLLLYATLGVSFGSSTSYGPSRCALWSAFSLPILPFGVDGSRQSGAGVAYRCARRGWAWPPRLVCSIPFFGLPAPSSDALSDFPSVRPLRGRASGPRASRVYFFRFMAARGALSLLSRPRRGVLSCRSAGRHVAVCVRLGVR